MIIGIDGNEANVTTRVGVGQYAYNILKELSQLSSKHKFVVYLKSAPLADMPEENQHWQYKILGPQKLWTRFALPLYLFLHHPVDLFYSPSHYSPFPCLIPTIPTIHDIGYLQNLAQFNKKDIYQLVNWTKDSLRQSKNIIAVSDFTKSELLSTYNLVRSTITVCPNGVGEPPKITTRYKIDSPYFLSVGTLKPNKNYPFLINAFSQYLKLKPSNLKLVIAGKKGWLYDEIFKTVTQFNLQNQVIFTDFITESEKWYLYKNAIATVIPSTYEGFGIPAIESQKVGTPVIASNIPSLTEVLEDSALFIDPTDTSSLVKALNNIQKQPLRDKLIKNGLIQSAKYTWKNSAIKLLSVFDSLNL